MTPQWLSPLQRANILMTLEFSGTIHFVTYLTAVDINPLNHYRQYFCQSLPLSYLIDERHFKRTLLSKLALDIFS